MDLIINIEAHDHVFGNISAPKTSARFLVVHVVTCVFLQIIGRKNPVSSGYGPDDEESSGATEEANEVEKGEISGAVRSSRKLLTHTRHHLCVYV